MQRRSRHDLVLKLAIYSLFLNFAWEMLQGSYFVGMVELAWWDATRMCLRASIGDAVMIVVAYLAVAVATRDRAWTLRPGAGSHLAFAGLAALQALALEWISIGLHRWSYVPAMPVDPVLGLGLAPILQWIAIPLLSLWVARRG